MSVLATCRLRGEGFQKTIEVVLKQASCFSQLNSYDHLALT